MAQLETVKIVSDKSKSGFVIINVQDLNPETDVVYDENVKAEKIVDEIADKIDETPKKRAKK